MTAGFIGLGLMGGALAMALRTAEPDACILACDKNQVSISEACKNGLIDQAFLPDAVEALLARCDLVFVCLYPRQTIEFIQEHIEHFKSGCLVTDIAGVKEPVVSALQGVFEKRRDLVFIPGHPMAGSEKEGFAHASACNFRGKNYILCPLPDTDSDVLQGFKQLITKMGFGNIIETSAKIHDSKIAFTSQLCHLIAAALVDSAEDTAVTSFGGGSFEDLTRIAMINAPMWTELFLANKNELVGRIEVFEASLDKLKSFLVAEQAHLLQEDLQQVRQKRISMNRKN